MNYRRIFSDKIPIEGSDYRIQLSTLKGSPYCQENQQCFRDNLEFMAAFKMELLAFIAIVESSKITRYIDLT